MDFTIPLAPLAIFIIAITVLYRWYSGRKSLLALEEAARRLGLSNLRRSWLSQVSGQGNVNGLNVSLEGSCLKKGIDLILRLHLRTSLKIYIRRVRHFYNFDIGNLLAGNKPIKLGELVDKRFEVFSGDVLLARRICYDSYIMGLLEQCIQDQSDSLSIYQRELVINHLILLPLFPLRIDVERMELELNCIWNLIDSISSLVERVALNIESLICPFCRDHLMKEATLIQCEKCLAIFHEGCWDENGRQCAVFNCANVVGNILQSKN